MSSQAGRSAREPLSLLIFALVALGVSGIGPKDRLTWWLEVAPVLIGALLLVPTFWRFRLTPLVYRLLTVHALILVVGGHYTYAEVPAGFWVQDLFGFTRNHYDRLGHFAQGFVPALARARNPVENVAVKAGRLAVRAGDLRLSCVQCLL